MVMAAVSKLTIAILTLALLGPAALAAAQTANGYSCGRVTAYTTPTATTGGSIRIGTSTFQLAAGATAERQIGVGQDVCLQGDRNASGAYTRFTVIPMGEGTCGAASSYVAPTSTQPGRLTLTSVDGALLFGIAPGTEFTASQVTGRHCYRLGVRSDTGDAEINAYVGPWDAPTTPGPSQLPSTSTAPALGSWQGVATALLAAAAVPADAQIPPTLECGRVNAYTAPTATASGSIQLGTSTFILAAGSRSDPTPPNLVVGATVCLSGEQNGAGEFLPRTVLVGDTLCGTVTAFGAATRGSKGSLTLTGNRARTVAVRQGVTLSGVQTSATQCFKFAFDGAGNPEIVGGATTPSGAPVRQLPSTSTEREAAPLVLALISIAGGGAIGLLARRAVGRSA